MYPAARRSRLIDGQVSQRQRSWARFWEQFREYFEVRFRGEKYVVTYFLAESEAKRPTEGAFEAATLVFCATFCATEIIRETKRTRVKPSFFGPRNCWRVRVPAAESETGKGIARYFPTEEEAQVFIAEHHKSGRPSFQLLQSYGLRKEITLVYYAFDLLSLDGTDLRSRPLVERRKLVEKLLKKAPENVKFSEELQSSKEELLGIGQPGTRFADIADNRASLSNMTLKSSALSGMLWR